MELFGYNLSKKVQPISVNAEVISKPQMTNDIISLSIMVDLPKIKESRNKVYVEYGVDNQYPEFLKDLYSSSPTHNAIVKTKSLMVVGEGYTYDDTFLSEADKINVLKIVGRLEGEFNALSLDFQYMGAMAFEIIWSLDFSRVVEVNRVDASKLRSGKFEDGVVKEWYYKRDWSDRREEISCIKALDKSNKTDHRQLLYVPGEMVSNEYYGEPGFIGAIDWIALEAQCGVYYRNLIENGFSPSVVVKFFQKPANQEERDAIVGGMKRAYTGTKGSKFLAVFSDGKELSPEITPMEVSNMDKQYTVLADQITQKILTGERVTTTELFGIAYPGQLGSSDFDIKVRCFEKFVIRPDQKIFEAAINEILSLNGYDVNFKLNPFVI